MQTNINYYQKRQYITIRESVDSLCIGMAPTRKYVILKQKPYNFTTNTLKAYLSAQASSLRVSKTHKWPKALKPRKRQLNKKVCGSKSAIFVILSFFLQTTLSNKDNSKMVQAPTLILARNGCSSQRAPFSVFIASNSPWSTKAIHNTPWLLSEEVGHG